MTNSKLERRDPTHRARWKKIDIALLGLLVLSLMLYQLQLLVPQLAVFHVRETLYLYLYVRLLLFHRPRLKGPLMATVLFLGGACFVAAHTYYLAGPTLAIPAFTRFVHLALLAPLAAGLLEDGADARLMIYLWMCVVVIGILTVAYQMLGGEMAWLVQNYIAIRGDLVRHKSLMGEPNVGGMAAALLYLLASMIIAKGAIRYFLLFVSVFLIVVSLSKAAVVGFVFANAVILADDYFKAKRTCTSFPSRGLSVQIVVVVGWILLMACQPLLYKYMEVGFNSMIGRQTAVPGAFEDFNNRFVFFIYGGSFDLGTVGQLIFGQSFERAGSVAVELKVPHAVGPHNMYLELCLVGGLVLLGLFIAVQTLSIRTLARRLDAGAQDHAVLLPPFLLISLYMMGYPNLYEPITGTLFWLIVGMTCRSSSYAKAPACDTTKRNQ